MVTVPPEPPIPPPIPAPYNPPVASTLPPWMLTVPPEASSCPPPIPAAFDRVVLAFSTPMLLPSLWAKIFSVCPLLTSMPSLASSVEPSQRMRFTVPLTVIRLSKITLPVSTRVSSYHSVLFLVTALWSVLVISVRINPFVVSWE